jgi:hypothetical protein
MFGQLSTDIKSISPQNSCAKYSFDVQSSPFAAELFCIFHPIHHS